MKILDSLKGFEHTVTHWIASEWTVIYNEEPKIEAVADTFFKYAIPAAGIVLNVVGEGALSPVAVDVLQEAQRDMHAVSALIYDFGPTPQAGSAVNAIATNLGGILTDAHIKDPKTVGQVKKIVGGAVALAALMPAPQAPSAAAQG